MFILTRFCCKPAVFPQVKYALRVPPKNVGNGGIKRLYSVVYKQPLRNSTYLSNAVRGSVTAAIRLNSGATNKGGKAVGYWLLTCGGMVFVAVVLGIVAVYTVILVSVCTILSEVIKTTVR